MAELRIEVAGTGDSRAVLKYLALADANRLRAEILARAAGVRHDAGEAPETVIVIVPTKDLALSLVMRGVTFTLLLLTVVIVVGAVATEGAVGVVLVLFTGGLPLFMVFGEFSAVLRLHRGGVARRRPAASRPAVGPGADRPAGPGAGHRLRRAPAVAALRLDARQHQRGRPRGDRGLGRPGGAERPAAGRPPAGRPRGGGAGAARRRHRRDPAHGRPRACPLPVAVPVAPARRRPRRPGARDPSAAG